LSSSFSSSNAEWGRAEEFDDEDDDEDAKSSPPFPSTYLYGSRPTTRQ